MPAPSEPVGLADEHDTPMTGIYVAVVVVEVIVIALLWMLGRVYS